MPVKKRLLFILSLTLVFQGASAQCPDLSTLFSASQTAFCGPGTYTVSFTNTSTGTNNSLATYKWYLGGSLFDNTTGLTSPSNITLNTFGTYTVQLVGTDSNSCHDTASVEIYVVPVPDASFTFSPNNECAARTVTFTNTSTNTVSGTSYSWDFGDGNNSNLKNPTHVYAVGGTYTITLTVTNAAGCTDTYSLPITVKDIPLIGGITGDGGDGTAIKCLSPVDPQTSYTVNFSNNTTNAVGYSWDFGDGNTSTTANPTHTYNTYGTFQVIMTATGSNGCTVNDTMKVVFEKFVSASIELNPTEYSGCAPLTLTTLQNNSINANSYTWDFGDGSPTITTTSLTPPLHSYTTGGTYTISLTASNSCNTAYSTIGPIIVVGKPKVNFSFSGYTGCAPTALNFSNSTTGASPANAYQWDMGNGNTYSSTITPPTQTYDSSGTYTITLTASNACGDSTLTRTITLDTIPIAAIDVTPDEGCSPLTVNANNNSTGHITYYDWYRNGAYYSSSSNIGPLTYSYPPGNSPVTNQISLTVGNSCGSTSDTASIVVHRPTKADFTASPTEVCLGDSITFTNNSLGENLTYDWDFDNGTTDTSAGSQTITYTAPGTYNVTLVAEGYCGNDTDTVTVVVHPYPVADFAPDSSSGCEDLEMGFTNSSTSTATQSWNFGATASPSTSTSYNPGTITFPTPGTQEITLTVSQFGCVSHDTNYVDVYPLPTAAFTVSPTQSCTPLLVNISNSSSNTGVETYSWTMGNGNTSSAYNPPNQTYIAINNDSTYNIKLVVTSGNACRDSVTHQVVAHPIPVADFSFVDDTICQNMVASFVNNSTPGMIYNWNFGDGNTSTVLNPTHTYASSVNYMVKLIVTSPFSCADTISKEIVVEAIPTAQFVATTACLGYQTEFTDQSTGSITNWNWNLGDGNTSTTQNPTHTYSGAGTYSVELTVTSNNGCASNYTANVSVNTVPIADFSAANFCANNSTQFTNLTTGSTTGMQWDFGDGSPTSNTNAPSHQFPAAGNYNVKLIAIGGSGCSDTITKPITINPIPTANFSFVNVCSKDTTIFSDLSSGNPDSYIWNFGNGNTSTQQNPKVVYTDSNTYNVTLVVGYVATGCTDTITQQVRAYPRTIPDFSATTACLNSSTAFTDLTQDNPTQWNWNFGDGSPANASQNPSHNYSSAGTYTVQLITENIYGCKDTISKDVIVNPLPTPAFAFDTVCLNSPSHFTDSSVNSVSWFYDFGDGNSSGIENPTHLYSAAGTYIVKQIVTNSFGCKDSVNNNVIVRPNPTAMFVADTTCYSFPTTFTNQSQNFVSSQWLFGDTGATSTATSPIYTYSQNGIFHAELIVKNIYGCTDTVAKDVDVLLQPVAGFINTTVCARNAVNFTDTSTGNPNSFQWNFGDGSGIFSSENMTHVFSTGGFYTVKLIVGNAAGCSDTTTKSIEVYSVPNPNFIADTACLLHVTHFTDLSVDVAPISTWAWDFGDGNTSAMENPAYIYQNAGAYNVTLTVTNINGCDSSFTRQVEVLNTPQANFNYTTACFGAPTIFTDSSTNNPGIYIWNFGDGTVVNGGPNEQHTYASPGTYIVKLSVYGSDSVCGSTKTRIVTIAAGAQANFLVPVQVCVNDTFNFYDNSSTSLGTIVSYLWNMGNGTTYTTQNGTYAYDSAGVFHVSLYITTSDGCQAYRDTTINVLPAPTADFAWENTCINQTTQFTNTTTGGTTSWFWDFGDGNTSQTQFPTHQFINDGSYQVVLKVQNLAGCSDTIQKQVTIYPIPSIDFVSDTVCFGDTTSFTNLSTINSGTIVSFNWNFGAGEGVSTQENPQYQFTTYTQTHPVTLIAVSDQGCADTLTKTVDLLPIVNFNVDVSALNGCAPLSAQFDNQSNINQGSILSYDWNFSDGDSSFQSSPTHLFTQAGTYPVTLTVKTSSGCTISNSDSMILHVYPSPTAGFKVDPYAATMLNPTINITDISSGVSQWEYDLGDGDYSNMSSFSHKYNAAGTYTIIQYVQNQYGCLDTASRTVIIQNNFVLYVPNAFTPADKNNINDVFKWSVQGCKTFEMRIFNRWGQVIYDTKNPQGYWDGSSDGELVPVGVYVWQVKAVDVNGAKHAQIGHVTVLK